MGREVRKVPADWQHPRDERGRYIPLLDGSFSQEAARWDEESEKWQQGLKRSIGSDEWEPVAPEYLGTSFEEWDGERPDPKDYMPDWPESERTHFQMYENVSEGTPISPPMATEEELARWLTDTKASAGGYDTATYEQWLATVKAGHAFSMVIMNGRIMSGVEAMADVPRARRE